ncbi:hypothetical protein RHMOL_Rhmol02G0143200 [Rhododendron molle]|uniref:Uncharacterized protein n=1 Tax=Rhododendron molle TaxID=49168 RepID=A0ACC0PQ56_RHOML|nr:hypothetical protein RHMOL_Rhmol02G0143200 [Rhododendron molle]
MLCPGGGFWLVSAADFSPLFFFFWVDRRRVVLKEIRRCGLKFAVAGIPQTIDNYILVIDKSFGFDTTIEEAQRAIIAAHVEFDSIENGFGLVKLLGRYSGKFTLNGEIVDQNELREKELPFVQDVEAKVKELTQIIPGLNNHQMSLKASIKKMEEKAKEMHEKLWF